MIKKIKKLLVISGGILLPATSLLALAVSCTPNDKKTKPKDGSVVNAEYQKLVIYKQNALATNPAALDSSLINHANIIANDPIETLPSAQMVRIQTLSSPEYNDDANKTLKKPGLMRFKMLYASKIIVTITENNEDKIYTFDNDKYDLSNYNKTSGKVYEYAISNDPKSINSLKFKEVLSSKNVKNLQIVIKEGFKWIDSKGVATKYNVVAKDFWYGFLRSYFSGIFQRARRGLNGTPAEAIAADKLARKIFGDDPKFGSRLFTHTQKFDIYGVDSTSFLDFDKNTFEPKTAVKNNTIVFNAKENDNSKNFYGFFELMLAKSLILNAAPSQKIDEMGQNVLEMSYKDNDNNYTQDIAKIGQGIVRKIGYYFYGSTGYKNNLYAGAYYPDSTKSGDNDLYFVKNLNYVDQEFVNSNNNIKEIDFKTNQISTDNMFDNFENNQNAILNYSNLNETQKAQIENKVNDYNVLQYKDYIFNSTVGNTAFNITPQPREKGAEIVNYDQNSFNDNYAKLVYGASISEILNGFRGTDDFNQPHKSIGSGVFENLSIAFRTMINGAINWSYLNSETNPNTTLWLTNAAPDSYLSGTDQATAEYKTPRDAADLINDLIFIDQDGNKFIPEVNDAYKNTVKSIYFDSIKVKMQALLNKFYADNNLDSNQKIVWKIYNNKLINDTQKRQYNDIIALIKELDPRLAPEFVYLSTQADISAQIGVSNGTGKNSIAQYIVFDYDDDTVSPYLDKITHAIGMSPFALWYKFSQLDVESPLAKAFPQMKRFSDELEKAQKNGNLKYNEIYTGTTEQGPQFRPIVWDDLDKFNSYEERNLYLRGMVSQNNNEDTWQIAGIGGIGYKWDSAAGNFSIDNIEQQAKFANYYVSISTNEQLVELLRELNTWRSFTITLDKKIVNNNVLSSYITHKNLEINAPYNNAIYIQDYKVK